MKVVYEGRVPRFMRFPGFEGAVKNGDELEMNEQTLKEFSNLKFKKVSSGSKKSKTEEDKRGDK